MDKRVLAAEAFWNDEDSPDIALQQTEAALLLARRLNFRAKSIHTLSVERRARQLAQIVDLSDAIATRALVAYHFSTKRALMTAFLDTLGIRHETGLITEENVVAPNRDRLSSAIAALKPAFDATDVDLYLRTLAALDGDTWANLEGLLAPSSQ